VPLRALIAGLQDRERHYFGHLWAQSNDDWVVYAYPATSLFSVYVV